MGNVYNAHRSIQAALRSFFFLFVTGADFQMGYALHQTAMGLLVLAFSMMPGLVALHFWGLLAGALVAAAGPAIVAARWACQMGSGGGLKSFLTTRCDVAWHLHPLLTVACGAAFSAAGLWIIAFVTDGAGTGEKRMTSAERSWFGAIFVLLGSGILLSAVSSCVVRFSRQAQSHGISERSE